MVLTGTPLFPLPYSDGKLDFNEFQEMIGNTDIARQLTLEVRSLPEITLSLLLTNCHCNIHRISFELEPLQSLILYNAIRYPKSVFSYISSQIRKIMEKFKCHGRLPCWLNGRLCVSRRKQHFTFARN